MKQGLVILTILGSLAFSRASSAQPADPAGAQKGIEVSIYGRFIPFLEYISTTGATETPTDASQLVDTDFTGTNLQGRGRMTTGITHLGFKGNMNLDAETGLKVIWQIETSVGLDGDGLALFGGRNTGVGLGSNYGTVIYALWDTPYKFVIPPLAPLRGATPFDNNTIIGNPGFNVPVTTTQTGRSGAKPDAAFHRRQGNSIQYWSPPVSGLTARLAYSINEGKTAAPTTNPQVFAAMVGYENGPLVVRGAVDLHLDYFGLAQIGGVGPSATNDSSTDVGALLEAVFTLPSDTKISAIVERLSYKSSDTVTGDLESYQRDAAFFLLQQRFGPHYVWGGFGIGLEGSCDLVGGGDCSTDGLGATQFNVGYSISLAKTAEIFLAYYQLDNKDAGTYNVGPLFGAPAMPGGPAVTPPGATIRGFGLGFLYLFDGTWQFPL